MKIFKKIGFVIVYYFLASLIDQILMMFFGNVYVTLVLTALCISVISCYLRRADIIKRNYLQEQRDEYNKSFKSRFTHIVSDFDFKVELIIGTVVALLIGLIPRLAMGACYGFVYIYALLGPFTVLLYIPLFAIINFLIWYFAYRGCFKKKKY